MNHRDAFRIDHEHDRRAASDGISRCGAYIRAREPREALQAARQTIETASVALSQTIKDLLDLIAEAPAARHTVTIDLDADKHTYFVLTDALQEWASDQRHEAGRELADDPEDTTAHSRLAWAETADKLLARIEAAL